MTDSIEKTLPETIRHLVPLVAGIVTAFNHIACLADSLGQEHIRNASNDASEAFMKDVGKMVQAAHLSAETGNKPERREVSE